VEDADFLSIVRDRARLRNEEEAERVTNIVLEIFGEHLSVAEAQDIADQLPPGIGKYILEGNKAESFGLDEFLARISEREGVSKETAELHARAVLSVMVEQLTKLELEDVLLELPNDLRAFMEHTRKAAIARRF